MITLTAMCNKHPRYKGIRSPKVPCRGCRGIFDFRAAVELQKTQLYDFDALGALENDVTTIEVQ